MAVGSYNQNVFDENLKKISEQTDVGDIESAVKTYSELKKEYQLILESSVNIIVKQTAYEKILKTYHLIIEAKQKVGAVAKSEIAKEEKLLLHEAVSDIEKQISLVSSEEAGHEDELREIKAQIFKIHQQEKELRLLFNRFASKENNLNSKRLRVVEQLGHLKNKKKEMETIVEELKA